MAIFSNLESSYRNAVMTDCPKAWFGILQPNLAWFDVRCTNIFLFKQLDRDTAGTQKYNL